MVDQIHTHTSLTGKHVLVTAGPTRAWLDPVRYLANASTGLLGAMIAEQLLSHGARVVYVQGVGAVTPAEHPHLRVHIIETVEDLVKTLTEQLSGPAFDTVIHSMAVLDYQPAETQRSKHPSGDPAWTITLEPTPKVINTVKRLCPEVTLVGFKLGTPGDTPGLLRAARKLLGDSGADLVVANFPPPADPEQHLAYFLDRQAAQEHTLEPPHRQGKRVIAEYLCDWLARAHT